MTDTVTAKLAEWEALVEGATEGEWSWIHDTRVSGERVCRIGSLPGNHDVGWTPRGNGEADANFIAASRTAMPALLGFVREVQHILATQRHEVIGARGLREQDVVRARDIEQAARKWIGGDE